MSLTRPESRFTCFKIVSVHWFLPIVISSTSVFAEMMAIGVFSS